MGYENDPYVDEDGEPLMNPDDLSDREASPDPNARFVVEDDDDEEDWQKEPSPSPAYDEDKVGRTRKRLVKKSGEVNVSDRVELGDLEDWDDEGEGGGRAEQEEEEDVQRPSPPKKMKGPIVKEGKGGSSSGRKREKRAPRVERERERERERSGGKSGSKSYGAEEEQELWDAVAGGDSENDEEGLRTIDDDKFIDDTGVDPDDRFGSDNEVDLRNVPQAEVGEVDEDINKLFKGGKKKKKNEKTPEELTLILEGLMADLEAAVEDDAELNRQSQPAVNKLKKLPLLIEVLSKKKLQERFLDHGVLSLLKNWLEPLPDGSLPNMNIRSGILRLLSDYHIDLEQDDRREQLKDSGLGKVIMFLSKSDEENTSNRKLAKELVDKWSRPIFKKSTRFEDMRSLDDERMPYRRPPPKRPVSKAVGIDSRDEDMDEFSQGKKSGQASSRQHASRPEALALDFVVRPQSKIDPEEIRARAKQMVHDQRRLKMNKKLQQLKAPKKKQLQASKISVEGRGMVKYL